MKVRDIMTESVEWVTPTTSIIEAANLMKRDDIGSVPVCEQNKLLGIITDRDIVIRGVASGGVNQEAKVQDMMSADVISVTPDHDAHAAADLMSKYQIRRLPVLEQGRLVGMLALGDLATEKIHVNEAGDALSDISQGVHH